MTQSFQKTLKRAVKLSFIRCLEPDFYGIKRMANYIMLVTWKERE
jgi:hypothetical protein